MYAYHLNALSEQRAEILSFLDQKTDQFSRPNANEDMEKFIKILESWKTEFSPKYHREALFGKQK